MVAGDEDDVRARVEREQLAQHQVPRVEHLLVLLARRHARARRAALGTAHALLVELLVELGAEIAREDDHVDLLRDTAAPQPLDEADDAFL